MDAGDLVGRGGARLDLHQAFVQAAYLYEVAEATLGLGVLGVDARLDGKTRWEHLGPIARVVPHIEFVADKAGRHFQPVLF
jgi:hypothetical protein